MVSLGWKTPTHRGPITPLTTIVVAHLVAKGSFYKMSYIALAAVCWRQGTNASDCLYDQNLWRVTSTCDMLVRSTNEMERVQRAFQHVVLQV